jgi:protein-tyrosine-phosphatase
VAPEVLFMCVHNAGRSQMAAALMQRHGDGQVVVRSAGSAPARELSPVVIAAMAEIGADISAERPKPLTDEAARSADVVVTMGCGDACPFYPGKRYLDWPLGDPAGKTIEEVRVIRDEIDRRVRALLAELVPSADAHPGSQPGKDARPTYAIACRPPRTQPNAGALASQGGGPGSIGARSAR